MEFAINRPVVPTNLLLALQTKLSRLPISIATSWLLMTYSNSTDISGIATKVTDLSDTKSARLGSRISRNRQPDQMLSGPPN